MDLTDILRKRAEADLSVAMARSLELSFSIEKLASEIKPLRVKLAELEHQPEPEASGNDDNADFEFQPQVAVPKASLHETAVDEKVRRPLHQRLFGKFVSRSETMPQFHWHLDEIAGTFPVRGKGGVNAFVSGTSFPALTISGWIVPIGDNPAFAAVEITLLGSRVQITRETQTFHRADVAAHFGNPALSSCGFRLEIPMFEIPVGQYALKISGRTADGSLYTLPAGAVTIS